MITRELVGVTRSDAGVAAAGVGGGLEARVTCRGQQTPREAQWRGNRKAAVWRHYEHYEVWLRGGGGEWSSVSQLICRINISIIIIMIIVV